MYIGTQYIGNIGIVTNRVGYLINSLLKENVYRGHNSGECRIIICMRKAYIFSVIRAYYIGSHEMDEK
jgi:hypothetical protein